MSQTLILELSDEVYTTIQRQAAGAGTSPDRWLATALEQQYGRRPTGQYARQQCTDVEQQAARARFEQHFGEVDLSGATGVDNAHIDAELAREYTDTHEVP